MDDTPKVSNNKKLISKGEIMVEKPSKNSTTEGGQENHKSNGSPRNQLDGISLEHWLGLVKYHRGAMEVRRSIEVKVFTGCVVLLLLMGKTGYDILIGPGGTEQIRLIFQIGVISVPIFLLFFLWQIERVNKAARERYIYLEKKLDSHFKNEPIPRDYTQKEGCLTGMIKSWAATWPAIATTFLSLFVFICLGYVSLNVKVYHQDTKNSVKQTVIKRLNNKSSVEKLKNIIGPEKSLNPHQESK